MASTRASIYKASKRPKINIILPKQLFVDLTQNDTKTPSPKLQLSSPSAPNAPSKTPSTKDTSSSSIDYIPKSPTSSTSLSPNGYLNPPTSPPPRVSPPPPTQENASMDITFTLLPITPLDVQFDTPSPSPPIFGHPIPQNLLEEHGDSCLYVSSDEASSGVTYTSISSDYEEPSYAGSPRVVAPLSPDYVLGPEELEQASLLPDYVPGPEYPEYLAPSDDEIPVEDQPHAADTLPIALAPGYIVDSDLEEDPKDESEDVPTDCPADGGDDDDDESFGDDADDEEEEEASEEDEEEEHLAPANFTVVSPVVDPVPSAKETEPFETDESAATPPPPPPAYRTTARMSIRSQAPIPFPSGAEIPSPPLPLPSPPLPPPLSPLLLPSTDHRSDIPEAVLPPWKRITELRRDRVRDMGYGITDVWEDSAEATKEVPPTTVAELSQRVTDLVTTVRQDTDGIYVRFGDARDDWTLLRGQSMGCSRAVHDELHAYRTHTQIQDTRISSLEALVTTLVSHTTSLQTQLIAALGRIDTLEARELAHTYDPKDADSCTQGVADALAEQIIQRNTNLNGDGSQGSGSGITRSVRPTLECTYSDFLKCQPLNFKSTEGVVGLTQWFERMESVFHISNRAVENQVKFATCTLHGISLTWWNTHVKIVSYDDAYGMTWKTLIKMMTAKYCPRNEIKKLEIEIWNMKVKGTDMASYTQHFQELALMKCDVYQTQEMEEAIEMENNLMDQKLRTLAERQIENKRKQDDNFRDNQNQQQPNKRQNTGRAYTAGPSENREYGGSLLKCSKCNYHHNGPCAPKSHKCNKVGHLARDCRSSGNANAGNNQRATGANQKGGNGNAPAKVYVVGNTRTNPDFNVVTGTLLLNNRYASILFDTTADRSFVSTAFSSLIDITPTTLDHYYDVELAEGKIIGINTIIRACTLNYLNHPFNIDIMPVELGSFDFLIGMDWLAKYHAVIVCDEKLVCIPFGNETLIVCGDESNQGNETRLNIISCTKTQKYMLKGCHVFLAHVTTKNTEDKSEEKRLEDVPTVRDFLEVFPEDLPGIPPV
ncbi:putative reverse transcriptase domain-containing protein [Tanacetum coccineum]